LVDHAQVHLAAHSELSWNEQRRLIVDTPTDRCDRVEEAL
jgi:hypothetical protein